MCRRAFYNGETLATHLKRHVSKELYCAYVGTSRFNSSSDLLKRMLRFAGCELCFSDPKALLSHVRAEHRNGRLRPDTAPFKAELPLEEPYVPDTLPSYMSVAQPLTYTPISAERHQTLGPWVRVSA